MMFKIFINSFLFIFSDSIMKLKLRYTQIISLNFPQSKRFKSLIIKIYLMISND